MLFVLLGVHALAAAACLLMGRALGRWVWAVGALGPVSVVAWLAAHAGSISDGATPIASFAWVPGLGVNLDLRVDAFSALMLVLVSGVGALVFAYAASYFGSAPTTVRAAALLTLFSGAMVGVVIADNLLTLFMFWELTSITSYLLIGLHDGSADARGAARQALLVTGLGGLVMLAGLILLGQQGGTFRISELLAAPPSGTVTSVALVLVLVGAFTKSAQYPFHSWLPGAMVAPTPISAYLHSAAMVKVGVYLIARLAPAFADAGIWRPVVVTVGLVTMIAGGLRALRPNDLKQLLAFGTISQLGFLVVLFGIGQPAATAAGCALILAHALFKATLFMVVGIVDHETGTRDIRSLPRLAAGWGPLKAVALIAAASMAAVPPLAGFLAKEQAYGALVDGSVGDRFVLAGVVAGSILTVAYSLRFAAAIIRPDLLTESPVDRSDAAHAPSRSFLTPAMVLAAATVALGVIPALWSSTVDRAATALDPRAHAHLELWHGVSAPLLLSLLTLTLGVLVFAARRPVASAQQALAPRVDGTDVFEASVRGVVRGARRLTGRVQPGSLPAYAGVILLTAAVAPTVAMMTGVWWPGGPETAIGRGAHVPIVALLVIGAIAATVARRRFVAVILLGIVGYGMSILFVVQGAPDLALTQFAVETLVVVVFLLVMRRLPDRFDEPNTRPRQITRLVVAGAVGAFAVLMAIAMSASRSAEPVSKPMLEQAYPEGHGRNVVNVILVDIRGFDTLGEVTVLVAAALGIVALARAERPSRRGDNAAHAGPGDDLGDDPTDDGLDPGDAPAIADGGVTR